MEKQRLENKRRLPFMRKAKRRTLAVSIKLIYFHNGGAGYSVRVAYDRRVRPGREAHQNRGFVCLSRSNPAGGDRPAVRALPPIVVEADRGARRVVQFENWIENFPRQRKRWSDA